MVADIIKGTPVLEKISGARGAPGGSGWARLVDFIPSSSLRKDIAAMQTDVEVSNWFNDATRTGKNVWVDDGLYIASYVEHFERQTIAGGGRNAVLQQKDNSADPILVGHAWATNDLTIPLGGKLESLFFQAGTRTTIATGAKTDAAGYAAGATSITLAAAGAGDLEPGDTFRLLGDTYNVRSSIADVAAGGVLTFFPKLKQDVPASETALTAIKPHSAGFALIGYNSRTRYHDLDFSGIGANLAIRTANGSLGSGSEGGQHFVDCRWVGCYDGALYCPDKIPDMMIALSSVTTSGHTDGTEAGTRAALFNDSFAGAHILTNKFFNNPNRILHTNGSASLIVIGNKIDAGWSQPLLAETNSAFKIKISDYQDGRPLIDANNWRVDPQNIDQGSGVYRSIDFTGSDSNNLSVSLNEVWLDPTAVLAAADSFKFTAMTKIGQSHAACVGNDYSENITQIQKGDVENYFGLDAPRVYAAPDYSKSPLSSPYIARAIKSGLKGPGGVRYNLIDDLFDALSGDWLANLDVFYLLAATSEGLGLFNIVAPGSLTGIDHGGAFTADRGIAGDGAAAYIETGAIAFQVENYSLGNGLVLAWSGTNLQASQSNLWGQISGSRSLCNPRNANDAISARSQNSTSFATPNGSSTNSIGSFGTLRPDLTQFDVVGRGVVVATCSGADPAAAATATGTNPFTLLRDTNAYSARTIQAFMLGGYMDATAYAAADAAMTQYLAAIGAPHV